MDLFMLCRFTVFISLKSLVPMTAEGSFCRTTVNDGKLASIGNSVNCEDQQKHSVLLELDSKVTRTDVTTIPCGTVVRHNLKVFAKHVTTVRCPEECQASPGPVWGAGLYTDDSHVCKAAIHDGRITPQWTMELLTGSILLRRELVSHWYCVTNQEHSQSSFCAIFHTSQGLRFLTIGTRSTRFSPKHPVGKAES